MAVRPNRLSILLLRYDAERRTALTDLLALCDEHGPNLFVRQLLAQLAPGARIRDCRDLLLQLCQAALIAMRGGGRLPGDRLLDRTHGRPTWLWLLQRIDLAGQRGKRFGHALQRWRQALPDRTPDRRAVVTSRRAARGLKLSRCGLDRLAVIRVVVIVGWGCGFGSALGLVILAAIFVAGHDGLGDAIAVVFHHA